MSARPARSVNRRTSAKAGAPSRRAIAYRRSVRRYRRLIRFADQLIAGPGPAAAGSVRRGRLTATERRGVAGLHGMIERLQAGQRRLRESEQRFELAMRERAARLGGSVDIESAPGQGACVRVRIPIAAREG